MNINRLPPYPHYPLEQGQSLYEIMYDINKFYGTGLGRGRVENSQVYVSKEGWLQLDVVCKNTKDGLITFRNYILERLIKEVDVDFQIINPILLKVKKCEFIEKPIVLALSKEIEFLTNVPLNEPVDYGTLDGVKTTRLLTSLLNQYSELGRWVTGSMGDLSTANFKLLHLGTLDGKWNGYLTEKSPYACIIQITEGTRKGLLCLMT